MRTVFMAVVAIALACGWLTLEGCRDSKEPVVILEAHKTEPSGQQGVSEQALRIAVGGMITPKQGLAYYRDLLRYIEKKLGRKVVYIDREGYAEINSMLETRQLEAAFVCSGPYVQGQKEFGLELLVAPQAYGETVYYSYIIVGHESPVQSLAELRGHSFAFTDPLSNTGKLVPTYMLAQMHRTPSAFFSKVIYTRSHDTSIKAVAQGVVDGAAVDSLIWEYLHKTDPEFTAKTKIVAKSPAYGIPPVVVPAGLDSRLKVQLRQVLLRADQDPQGKRILQNMHIDKFVLVNDTTYDSVRQMQEWLAQYEEGHDS